MLFGIVFLHGGADISVCFWKGLLVFFTTHEGSIYKPTKVLRSFRFVLAKQGG